MIVISVVVIAVVSASYAFIPKFRTGVQRLGGDVSDMLSTGQGRRSRPAAPALPNIGDYNPGGNRFRLPGSPDSGCASGVVCLPASSSPLGTPVNVCRPGDNC